MQQEALPYFCSAMRNIYLTIRHCALIGICILMQHFSASAQEKQERAVLSGKIISAEDSSIIDFADIFLKGTEYWCSADKNGEFRLEAPAGTYTFYFSSAITTPYEVAAFIYD